MKKLLLSFVAILFVSFAAYSEPLWMRYPTISPDGSTIAFTYKGSIYVVPATGGEAQCITPAESYDYNPVWSPDSKSIAYSSDRYGNFDVFTISKNGGTPKRVTTHSANEIP